MKEEALRYFRVCSSKLLCQVPGLLCNHRREDFYSKPERRNRHMMNRWFFVVFKITLSVWAVVQEASAVYSKHWNSGSVVSGDDAIDTASHPTWRELRFDVTDFGAVGDGVMDDSAAIQATLQRATQHAMESLPVGEDNVYAAVYFPPSKTFVTAPFNLTSHMILRVEGTLRAITNTTKNFEVRWPKLPPLPSYGNSRDANFYLEYQSLIFAKEATNVKIVGQGTIDGRGQWWWDAFLKKPGSYRLQAGRPNLIQFWNCTNIEIRQVTMKDSPFWTLHPVYSKDIYIQGTKILAPMFAPNVDGIDPDSCENVLIEDNDIRCGDDHIAIKAGVCGDDTVENAVTQSDDDSGLQSRDPIHCASDPRFRAGGYVTRNITIRGNMLRTGMGIALGSELSGGIEDVLVSQNYIGNCEHGHDSPKKSCGWGHAMHLKTTLTRGGFLRNIQFEGNIISNTTGVFLLETDYQDSQHKLPPSNYPTTDIRNITLMHNDATGEAVTMSFQCSPYMTCKDLTVENNFVEKAKPSDYHCAYVQTYKVNRNYPNSLEECMRNSMNQSVSQTMKDLLSMHGKVLQPPISQQQSQDRVD